VVRVVGVKAVGNCKVEDGRCDEMVAMGDGGLDGRQGCVSVWGCAGDVGGVGRGGVVLLDTSPHCLFGIHFCFGDL
jgi:hypothetical protein